MSTILSFGTPSKPGRASGLAGCSLSGSEALLPLGRHPRGFGVCFARIMDDALAEYSSNCGMIPMLLV